MFVTHFALGMGLSERVKFDKRVVIYLMIGSQVADILFGLFGILGLESGVTGGSVEDNLFDVPWSHSLLTTILWSVIYAGIAFYVFTENENKQMIGILGAVSVFSHFILDIIVHNDDMLLMPGSDTTLPSLYLWEEPILAMFLEIVLITLFWYNFDRGIKNSGVQINTIPSLVVLHILNLINFATSFSGAEAMELEGAFLIGVPILILLVVAILNYFIKEESN